MSTNKLRQVCGIALCALIPFGSGCTSKGPRFAEATGTVIYDGKPLKGATVTFIAEGGPPAIGNTDEQGAFRLFTHGKPEAFVGTHRIAIVAMHDSRALSENELRGISLEELYRIRKSVIPWKYNNPQTSGLTATVTSDKTKNHYPLELERGSLVPARPEAPPLR